MTAEEKKAFRRPLPAPAPDKKAAVANRGLWYEKYFDRWDNSKWELRSEGKKSWIEATAGATGQQSLLAEYVASQERLVFALEGCIRRFRTESPLLVGAGTPHPIEVGMSWHHGLGIPYIPGSSVRGMARAWATLWIQDPEVERILGAKGGMGTVAVWDAVPVGPVTLMGDVLTPHYPEFYRNKDASAEPHDWESPVPILYMSVAPRATFQIALSPGPRCQTGDVDRVAAWIGDALEFTGVGAKTSTGYGRLTGLADWMHPPKAKPARSLSPLEAEMNDEGYFAESDLFMQALTNKWINRVKDPNDPERTDIARLLMTWYKSHRPQDWDKPKGKNVDKVAAITTALNEDAGGHRPS